MQRLTSRGVTLIELVIGLLIVSLVMGFGVPSFSNWIQNAKIRTATEAAQNGLQLARAEAVKRNAKACIVLNADTSWVVTDCGSDQIQARSAVEGSSSVAMTSDASFIFNSVGRLSSPITSSTTVLDFTSTANGASCVTAGGDVRCMRIVVSMDGQIFMCDPAVTSTTDTRKCP